MADAVQMLAAALARHGYDVPAYAIRAALVMARVAVSVLPSGPLDDHLAAHRRLSEKGVD
jgi:hypothetical protein